MTETLVTSATIQTTTILFIDDAGVGVVKNRNRRGWKCFSIASRASSASVSRA